MDSRRRFLVTGTTLAAASAVGALADAPNVIAQPKFQWRMPTYWTPATDVLLGNAQRFAKMVEEMSGGRLKIQVFAAGEIVPAPGVFDACSQGAVEAYHATPYYWAGKEPATQWFAGVPFGLDALGMHTWYYQSDALSLWEQTYAPFNLIPRQGGSVGNQMMGWFRRKINTAADYKGLKMRIPGLGGKAVARVGGTVVLLPPGEVYSALERGVLDATEWVGPHDDLKLGLHNAARYYYHPGWHEPGTVTEFVFSKRAYESLPVDLRHTLDYVATAIQPHMLTEYERKNTIALQRLRTEFKNKVELVQLGADVIRELKKVAADVNREESEKSPMAKKVHASHAKFQREYGEWMEISSSSYHRLMGSPTA